MPKGKSSKPSIASTVNEFNEAFPGYDLKDYNISSRALLKIVSKTYKTDNEE